MKKKRNLLIVFTTSILSLSFQSKDANTPDCDVITFVTRQEAKTKKLNHDNVTPPQSILFPFIPVYFPPKQSTLQNNKKTHKHTNIFKLLNPPSLNLNEILIYFRLIFPDPGGKRSNLLNFVSPAPPCECVCVCHLFFFLNQFVLKNY